MGAVMSEAGDIQACEALIFAQGYLFELLHKAFGGQPDAEVIGVLASSITADAIEEVESGSETLAKLRRYLGRLGEGAGDDAFLEAAREEYGRFFQGPAAPPAFPW